MGILITKWVGVNNLLSHIVFLNFLPSRDCWKLVDVTKSLVWICLSGVIPDELSVLLHDLADVRILAVRNLLECRADIAIGPLDKLVEDGSVSLTANNFWEFHKLLAYIHDYLKLWSWVRTLPSLLNLADIYQRLSLGNDADQSLEITLHAFLSWAHCSSGWDLRYFFCNCFLFLEILLLSFVYIFIWIWALFVRQLVSMIAAYRIGY